MPAQFAHVFGKIRHGRMEQVKVGMEGWIDDAFAVQTFLMWNVRCEFDLLCYNCRRRWMGSQVFLWRAATNMATPCYTLLAGPQTFCFFL